MKSGRSGRRNIILRWMIWSSATVFVALYSSVAWTETTFEPPDGKVLVFIGQDNGSVGGTEQYRQGYVDKIGVPAGITHYIYMVENKTNKFGYSFAAGTSEGLNREVTWGAGPMCLRCYLESESLDGTLIALAISLEFGGDRDMASGKSDHLIEELADFLSEFSDRVFLLRIAYEFEGSWNGYDSSAYIESFRRIVDRLKARCLHNFATVMQSASAMLKRPVWEEFYPGDEYVDWIGYSYWGGEVPVDAPVYRFAEDHDKPLFVAESTPRGYLTPDIDGEKLWEEWFEIYFDHIEKNPGIKAISYINADWESQPMWRVDAPGGSLSNRWGDSRIEANDVLMHYWLEMMSRDRYIHGPEGVKNNPDE
jgi:hypothetical protein